MGTIVTGAAVLAAVVLAVCSMAKEKKKGKSISCGGDCRHCSRKCH